MKPFCRRFAAAALLALAACSAPATRSNTAPDQVARADGCNAGAQLPASDAGLRQVRLCIDTRVDMQRTSLPFTAELAQTPAEQERGLMFRTALAPDHGMLFPFPREKVASFWMKNTVIPLDLLFIRRDGTIESIAADAVPYDLKPHASGGPVIAVLELPGGMAARKGIAPGDGVRWIANAP